MSDKSFTVSEAEWQVMKVLWKKSPLMLQDILGSLEHIGWSQTTIQTYLARLVKKNIVATERKGKGFLYTPIVSEEECQLSESRSFLKKVFGGSMSSMVASFIKSGNLSDDELKQIKSFIKEFEESRED